jgi:nucleoside-diphosphate-sugar epimerase
MKGSIVVTGGTGYLGANLVRELVMQGRAVHAITRPGSDRGRWGVLKSRVKCHNYDGSQASLASALSEAAPATVVHLASRFVAQHKPEDVGELIASNVLFGTHLAEAMISTGVRCLINTGTSWQHYQNQSYSPVNLYAASKQAFDCILRYYVEAEGLRVIVLKLFDTYGPGDWRPKLFSILRNAVFAKVPVAMSEGEQLIDLVHVDDVVGAYALSIDMLESESFFGYSEYALSSGKPMSLRELAHVYESILGVRLNVDWGKKPYRKREVMQTWDQGTVLPGWAPHVSIDDGIRRLEGNVRNAAELVIP